MNDEILYKELVNDLHKRVDEYNNKTSTDERLAEIEEHYNLCADDTDIEGRLVCLGVLAEDVLLDLIAALRAERAKVAELEEKLINEQDINICSTEAIKGTLEQLKTRVNRSEIINDLSRFIIDTGLN